jgi:hypothetical protein
MTLSLYDILSHLIPGSLIYVSALYTLGVGLDAVPAVPASGIAYILGYFVSTLSSWTEDILNWSWGGKPSSRLLDGHSIWKVKMFETEKAKSFLLLDSAKENPSNDELFQVAKRTIDLGSKTRVADLNSAYAFSRSIFGALLVTSALVLVKNPSVLLGVGALAALFVSWLRTKQRGYYFAREVLFQYLAHKERHSSKEPN